MNWNKGPALGGNLPRFDGMPKKITCIMSGSKGRLLDHATQDWYSWSFGYFYCGREPTSLVLWYVLNDDLLADAPREFNQPKVGWGD